VVLFVAVPVRFCADVHLFALSSENTEYLCLLISRTAEPVRHMSIELSYLAGAEDQVVVPENKAHAARKDI